MKIKLGADPELFLADATGKLRASCGLVGGTKQHPSPLPLGEGYAVQEDNVAIEFNIPPAEQARDFVDSIKRTLSFLRFGMKSSLDFDIVNLSAASFPEDQLTSAAAKVFGCDPDYNAWTGKRNPKPRSDDPNLRSCGGHVHVGYDKTKLESRTLIKMMDLYLGVPSVLMDVKGFERRPLYGKRGAYREKSFGVEYRTLGNFWVFDDSLIEWVWNATEKAVAAVEAQFAIDDLDNDIREAINKNNIEVAKRLVKTFNLEVVGV